MKIRSDQCGSTPFLRRTWPYLLFVGLVILYFFPVLFQGKVMLFNDLYSQHYPCAEWSYRILKQGSMPWWLGSVFCGFPLMDQGMVGFFNPIQSALYLCFSPIRAYHLTIMLFFLLPLVFTYLFARRLGLVRPAAALSAIAFVFGGFYITRIVHMTVGNTMQYFPLGLYLIERSLAGRGRILWGVSLVIGLQIVSGYPQYLFFSVFSYSAYYLLRCLSIRPRRAGRLIRMLVLWGGVVAVGAGIGCVQFLPSRVLVSQYSHRQGGFSYEDAAEQSFVPWHLVTYVFPDFYGRGNPYQNHGFWQIGGNYWEQACYVGILPLLLAAFSLRRFRGNLHVRIFWVLSGVSFLLALGRYTPLLALLRVIPNYRFFRMPIRWDIITSFSLAMLAGFGLTDLLAHPRSDWERFGNKFLAVLRWFLLGLLLIVIAGNLLFSAGRGVLRAAGMKLGEGMIARKAEQAGPAGMSAAQYREVLSRFIEGTTELASRTIRLTSPAIFVPLLWLIASYCLLARRIRGRLSPPPVGGMVLLLLVADLAKFGLRYNPVFDAEDVLSPPKTVSFLKKDSSQYRIFQYRYGPAFQAMYPPYGYPRTTMHYWRELLKPDIHMLWGIDSATGYFPLRFKRSDDLEDVIGGMLARESLAEKGLRILGMMNVKYVITGEWTGTPAAPLVYRDGIVRIYRNPYWLPRAFLVGSACSAPPGEILIGLREGKLLLERAVWLEGDPGEIGLSPADRAEILSWEDMKAVIRVRTAARSLLFASIPRYPGWSARIDGVPGELFQANYVFTAVPVPAGEHTIEFAFRPEAFPSGLILSGASLLIWVVLLAWGPRPRWS